MKAEEFKAKVKCAVERLINAYYGENTIVDTFTNSTLKAILDRNIDKLDGFICMFEDENGEIDAEAIVNTYAKQIADSGTPFDLRNFIENDIIKSLLPNKSLLIKKSDIMKILD